VEHYQEMSQFNYTLPSGAEFVVNGPPGATQAEADRIFYEQVAAGALVGYESGQTLTSPATRVTKFELSRLDRGTAGVDTVPILAIVQGLPVTSGIANPQSILSVVQALPIPVNFPNLANVAITNPIDEADIVLIKGDGLAPQAIGAGGIRALTEYQVQKLLAQIASLVDQESDQISQNKGIGRYGFTAYALELAGYVKPGTSLRFFSVNPEDFVAVMSSPSVWTGKDGVYSLTDLLNSVETQNDIQVQLMQQGYNELLANGTIATISKPPISISSGQVYTNGGLQSLQNLSAVGLASNINRLSGSGLTQGILQNAQTAGTTLNRLLRASDINLSTIASGAVNNISTGIGNLSNINYSSLAGDLGNRITGGVGALVTNASKFGSQATALWAKSGGVTGLTNLAGTQLSSLGSSLAGALPGSLNNISGQLTNLVPGNLSNLTSNLDVFGKAGTFATNFANPLGSLNNVGGLLTSGGGIGGALTGQLGSLQGALSGQLGSLQGALSGQLGGLTGALGNLGSFANLGAVSSLFGGGGDLVSGTQVAAGFNNTVNRVTLDAAFARIVGSSKVPLPTYQYPSLSAIAPRLDIQQAFNFLQNQNRGSGATFGQTVTI
jgi:hypothetical protein